VLPHLARLGYDAPLSPTLEARDLPLDIAAAHHDLSTSPASPFVIKLVVQRRHTDGVDTVRGCVLTRLTASATAHRAWVEAGRP